jgi:SulP family sulfate permease
VAALTLAAMIFGGILLDAVPALVLGGVLVWVGGGLMIEWLVLARRRMRPAEHAIVILIFASVVFIDFAVGVVVGLVAAMLLFAIEYGRVDVVRHELTGADFQSSLNAAEERRALLRRHGGAILILRLQGFLFFGTADMLRRRVQERVLAGSLRFLLVDFRRVGGIDSSALQSFSRLVRIARARNVEIVLTGLSRPMQAAVAAGFADRDLPRIEPDIEHGLKWCEDALLAPLRPDAADAAPTALEAMLDALTGSASIAGLIVPYWRRTLEGAGATVIAQGTACDDIFIVESGNASVVMEVPGDEPIRLAGVGPGAVIGEGAFYLREPRSASIVADGPLVVWRFTRDDLARLAEEAPAAAAAFHAGMATMLARRLIATNRLVRLLAD